MNNKVGIAAIIFGVAALITAVATAGVNFITLRWCIKAYEPFDRFMKKSEPMLDKIAICGDKMMDQYIKDLED